MTSASDFPDAIDPDDLCPMCHLLLYEPVTTTCNHTFCSRCLRHWADVSMSSNMTILPLSDPEDTSAPPLLEVKCPMCRTLTTTTSATTLAKQISARYPVLYKQRSAEDLSIHEDIRTIVVYIGNKHSLVPAAPGSGNCHDWTFFVRPSRTDIIAAVHIDLHPTFRPPTVTRLNPPYEIRRLGWGYFDVRARVVLKKGWAWLSNDAFGATKRGVRLTWTLDFEGEGSMGRCCLKVKRVDEELTSAEEPGEEVVEAVDVASDDDDDEWEDEEGDEDDEDNELSSET